MLRFSANLGFLYPDLPFLARIAAAARDGFEGIEFPGAYDHDPAEIVALLREHDLTHVLLNVSNGRDGSGEGAIACHPGKTEQFRAGLAQTITWLKATGCHQVNCPAGIAPSGADSAEVEAAYAANLAYAAPRLADIGTRLLIEPINTVSIPGFFLSTARHAERLLDRVGSDNLFIQFDIFHQQVMAGDIVPSFARLQSRIAHIQVADHPGRHEPGTGEINYPFVLGEIERLGYAGWIGCEYRPTAAGLAWMQRYR